MNGTRTTHDPLRRAYADILPAIRDLGRHCDLRPALDDHDRFMLTVSGRPTVHIRSDGSWTTDDDAEGRDPGRLLEHLTRERIREAGLHLDTGDWKAIAMDVLTLVRHDPPSAVIRASYRPAGDLLDVHYRPRRGMPGHTTISHPERQTRKAIERMLEQLDDKETRR